MRRNRHSQSASSKMVLINDSLRNEPIDRNHLSYITFSFLGLAGLMPWNVFLSAQDYFADKYPSYQFSFLMSLVFNYPNILMTLATVKFGPRFSFSGRIFTCLTIIFVILVAVPICASFITGPVGLVITLTGVFITGVTGAVLNSTIMGLASVFPGKYMGLTMTGQGASGILTIGLAAIIKAIGLSSDRSAMIYFTISGVIMIITAFIYRVFTSSEHAKYFVKQVDDRVREKFDESTKLLHATDTPPLGPLSTTTKVTIGSVLKLVWQNAIQVFLVFFVTLSLFPGITGLIHSSSDQIGDDWYGLLITALFMTGDFFGRTLIPYLATTNTISLWFSTTLRIVFGFLFFLCIGTKDTGRLLHGNIWPCVIMFLFASTNGFFGTCCMIAGSSKAKPEEKEQAGLVMGLSLQLGIFIGVQFAVVLLYFINGTTIWG